MQTEEIPSTELIKASHLFLVPFKELPKGIVALTIYTKDQEQLQLFMVPPYTFIPDHTHPDVVLVVTPLAGKMEARRNGQSKIIQGKGYTKSHRVEPGDSHGFSTFNEPVIYLARQTWLNNIKPQSLERNWSGAEL